LSVAGDARENKRDEIMSDEQAFSAWLVDVAQTEDEQNGTVAGKKKRVRGKPDTADGSEMDLVGPDQSVDASEGSGLSARRHLGVLWPSKIFEKEAGRKPSKQELSKVTVAGETFVGVIRDHALGVPTGCVELFDDRFSSLRQKTNLANSESATRSDECSDWFKAGMQKMKVNLSQTEATDSGGVGSIKLSLGASKNRNEDELDDIWMSGISFSSGSGPSPRKPSDTDSGGNGGPNSKKPRLSTGGGACVASQRDKLTRQQAKEIGTTEKVILEAEQTFRMMADIHTIKGVTVKQLEALEKKLADRLTPALISVYSHNYDAALDAAQNMDQLGMTCLENAKDSQQSLQILLQLTAVSSSLSWSKLLVLQSGVIICHMFEPR
jgi:hypothetical protein